MGKTTQPEKTEDSISTEEIDVSDIDLADGTAANPSLSFQDDQDLGLYRPGADRVGFVANGTLYVEVSEAAGGFEFNNQGTGNNPQLFSNADGNKHMNVDGGFEFENSGAGSNPTIESATDIQAFEVTGSIEPERESSAGDIGRSTKRWVNVVGNNHQVFSTAGHTNPVAQLDSDGLKAGLGDASSLDLLIKRDDASFWRLRDAADSADAGLRVSALEASSATAGLDLTGSGSIQDAGTDALTFDGSQNVDVPNGTLSQGGTAVVLETRTLTGGTGIGTIGDLSADRTINIDQTASLTWSSEQTFDAGLALNDGDSITWGTDGDVTATWTDADADLDIQGAADSAVTVHLQSGGGTGTLDINLDADNIGFFGTTPAAQQTAPGQLTDNSGGTVDGTIAAVSGSGDDATLNNNFADLVDRVNALEAALSNLGLTA